MIFAFPNKFFCISRAILQKYKSAHKKPKRNSYHMCHISTTLLRENENVQQKSLRLQNNEKLSGKETYEISNKRRKQENEELKKK